MDPDKEKKLVDYSFSSTDSDEPPKKKIGIVDPVINVSETSETMESGESGQGPEPPNTSSPQQSESQDFFNVTETMSVHNSSDTLSVRTNTTFGKFNILLNIKNNHMYIIHVTRVYFNINTCT